MNTKIDPFDILSGKVVKNYHGTFYFKDAGNNMQEDGWPIDKNLHREDGPAVVMFGGDYEYWLNGKQFVKPVYDYRVKSLRKYINPLDILSGKVVLTVYGDIFYFKEAGDNINWRSNTPVYENLHRLDGPAHLSRQGDAEWYENGKLHNLRGPAIITNYGVCRWYINNEQYTEIEFEEKIKCLRK